MTPRDRVTRAWGAQAGRLAPWLAVAMAAGVVAFFLPRADPPPWAPWAALLPLPVAVALAPRRPGLAWLLGLLGAAGLGFAAASLAVWRAPPLPELPRGAVVLTATVVELDALPGGARVTLRGATWDGRPPIARDIRVRLQPRDAARPAPGAVVRVRALVRPPSAPAYPGAWDFQRAAFFDGLGGSGFALGPVEVVAEDGAAPPLSGLRAAMEARALAAIPGDAGAVAAALLTGGQSAISPAAMGAMRDSGLAHLLSVSGLHIAVVMGLAFFVVRAGLALWPGFALRFGTKPWAALAGLAAGGFYTVLTGSQVPMLRSFAMAALVTAAILAGRRALSPRVWAVAAAAVMLWQPAAVLGPSFQMSFAAVLALIALAEALRGRLPARDAPWWRRALGWFLASVLTSLAAGLATLPFGLHHFGRLQLYGVAANAVAVPLTTVLVMPAGLLAALLMPLGLEAPALAVMGWGVEGVLAVARAVAAWPGASLAAAPLPGWGAALAGLGLAFLCLWRGPPRWLGVPILALALGSQAMVRAPDAIAAADGRLFLLRDGEAVFLERRPGSSRFVREAWLRAFGEAEAPDLPREGTAGRIECRPGTCWLRGGEGAPALALLRPAVTRRGVLPPPPEPPPCGEAAVILSPEPIRGRCEDSQVVDRFSVWRDGAHAVWLEPGGAVVLSDRAHRGERPWVPPRPRPRSRTEEPPAEVE